jgi:hypothetical protein
MKNRLQHRLFTPYNAVYYLHRFLSVLYIFKFCKFIILKLKTSSNTQGRHINFSNNIQKLKFI